MNKKLRRVLSSVLALVMMLSCVTVMNVSAVMAATSLGTTVPESGEYDSTYTTISEEEGVVTYTYDFAAYAAVNYNTESNVNFTISDGAVSGTNYFYGLTGTLQIPSGDSGQVKFSNDTNSLLFTIASGCTADITVKGTTGKSSNNVVTNYVNLYESSTSSTALTADSTGTTSVTYTGLSSGQTYYMTRANSNLRITSISISVSTATFSSGELTYSDAENGSFVLSSGDSNNITSGTTVTGGTDVTLTATPDNGYYATATVGGDSVGLTKTDSGTFTYTWSFDGDTEVVVTFNAIIERTDITGSVAYDYSDADSEAYVLPYGDYATGTYYFELTNGATITKSSRIATGGTGSAGAKSVIFSTGDLGTNTATLDVYWAPSGDSSRSLVIGKVDGEKTETLGTSSSSGTYVDAASYTLSSNTEYWLGSSSSGIYIRKITITVAEAATTSYTVTPNLTISGTAVESGTYTIDGTEYTIGNEVTLAAGTYTVTYSDGTNTYTGTLTVDSSTTTPGVALTQDAETLMYDFGGADGSLISTDIYTKLGFTSGSNITSGEYTLSSDSNVVLVSQGNARVYWSTDSGTTIDGTTYYGYFHTNGAMSAGQTSRVIKLTTSANKIITVVASGATNVEFVNQTVTSESGDVALSDTNGCSVAYVTQNAGTFVINPYGAKANIYRITVTDAQTTILSGNVYIKEGSTITSYPEELTFTNDTTGGVYTAVVDSESGAYSVEVLSDSTYTVNVDDSSMAISDDYVSITVGTDETQTQDIYIEDSQPQTVTGYVYGLDSDDYSNISVSFDSGTAVELNVTTGEEELYGSYSYATYSTTLNPGTHTVSVTGTPDGYSLSSRSEVDLVVSKSDTSVNFKNILFIADTVTTDDTTVYVDPTGETYSSGTVYETINEALAAVSAGATIYIAPGTYREQVRVTKNNISFINESDEDDVVITWYYGIDYLYNSMSSSGYYDVAYAVDGHTQYGASNWGTTVEVSGSNFYAEGIVFENSFNRYLTDEEIADNVTNNTSNSDNNTSADRQAYGFDPLAKTSTERAAAMVVTGAYAEFYNCEFLSSQDTLYTKSTTYFNNCLVQGETDYIFAAGSGLAVFDNCELVWAGYSSGAAAGYITAVQTGGKLLFRNCTISNATSTNGTSVTVEPGYYGRPWNAGSYVIFLNTTVGDSTINTTESDGVSYDGWYNKPAASGTVATSYFYNATATLSDAYEWTDLSATRAGTTSSLAYDEGYEYEFSTDDITGSTYLSAWVPDTYTTELNAANYDIVDDGYTTYDFTNLYDGQSQGTALADTIMDTNDAAVLQLSNMKAHSSNYGAYTDSSGSVAFTMATDATETYITISSSYNANSGTAYIYVNGEQNQTVDVTASTDGETKEAAVISNLSAGDVVTVSFEGVLGTFYTKGIVVKTDGTLTSSEEETAYNTYVFTYASDMGTLQSSTTTLESSSATSSDNEDIDAGIVTLDATSGKFRYQDGYGCQISANSMLIFTLEGDGTLTNTVSVNSSYSGGSATATVYAYDGSAVSGDALATVSISGSGTFDLEFEGTAGDYAVVITGDLNFYSTGITIKTTGTVAGAETSAFTFYNVIADSSDSSTVYVIGKIAESDYSDDMQAVGFGVGTTDSEAESYEDLSTTTVFSTLVINGSNVSEGGYYLAGFKITDVDQSFYVSAYTIDSEGSTVHDTATQHKYNEAE